MLHAQETIPASGGNAIESGGWVSYTVGQVFYNTITGSNGSAAQGVQQLFEISSVYGLEEARGITLQCEVFPNPTNDFLKLEIDASALHRKQCSPTFSIQSLNYQLFDISGKLLETITIESNETIIAVKKSYALHLFLEGCKNDV